MSLGINLNQNKVIQRLNQIYKQSFLPRVDLKELKYIVHTYYHTPLKTLLEEDNENEITKSSGGESSGIPSTSLSLKEKITWLDFSVVLEALKLNASKWQGLNVTGWETYVLHDWVGIVDLDYIKQIESLTGADNLKENQPLVKSIDIQNAVKELIKRLEKYL